ncbi:cell division protein FtsA [Candidatus Saccharibacteria bacterium]|nr:cell division protein FtsA [Candidatus Saccharibacteria bacterium]
MQQSSTDHFVGIDIGTSGVRCIIGMIDPDSKEGTSIVGHGFCPNLGMRKGVIVHPDDVAEALIKAVSEAERTSGVHVSSATVNVNGTHVMGIDSRGVIAIGASSQEISIDDRLRAEEAATVMKLPPNREIIQLFAKNYCVDGQFNIKDPVGMHGVRLEVDAHIVTAATPNIRNLLSVMDKAQIRINHLAVSSLAAAEAVLSRQQKESGTVLVDIGAGTTNIVVIEDAEVQHVAVLPIGGINITNDLAIGLKTDLNIAEIVKIKHATLLKTREKTAFVEYEGKKHSFDMYDITMITEARIEELLEFIDKELRKIHRSRKLPGGVVLVGGTSKIPGIDEYVREKLQLSARVGTLQPFSGLVDTLDDVTFATTAGLMQLDIILADNNMSFSDTASSGSKIQNVIEMFSKSFRKK